MNIKRWVLCAFLFIICFLFLRWLNDGKNIEGYSGVCNCGSNCNCGGNCNCGCRYQLL
jgi:hypothetical protein